MRGLYLVTDRGLCGKKPLEEIVLQAVKGGVAYVQLREKDFPRVYLWKKPKELKNYWNRIKFL